MTLSISRKLLATTAAVTVSAFLFSTAPASAMESVKAIFASKPAAPTAADAAAFITRVEAESDAISEEASRINWAYATNITYDTQWLVAKIGERTTKMAVDFAIEAKKFDGVQVDAVTRRKLDFIKQGITLPAPQDPKAVAELAAVTTRLSAAYSTGKIELDGKTVSQSETETLMRTTRDPKKLAEIWTKWHDNARGMKADYARMVELGNAGAKELGFADVGALWRSGYDMPPDDFAKEVDRIWTQVKPLYDELHCHVRAKLNDKYGNEIVPLDQPIRADLMGNMWAQEWGNVGDLVANKGDDPGIDLTKILNAKGYTPLKIIQTGEAFFTSLGFEPLPKTFWERSQIVKPRDREVVCHASAWDLDSRDDIRVKMCTEVAADDFQTAHHELGHNFYQRAYKNQPVLFKGGANDGFHEAIGDMVALSITPEYMKQLGLIDKVPDASKDLGLLMQKAMDGIAFLPFGLLVDKWRWQVFSGELTPATYNEGWWKLRNQYQGVRAPTARSADDFDPGAKFHIPDGTPYMRYFLARVLQYQFYKAACDQIGWKGPLHRCTFFGSKEVGAKFNAMLEMGSSKPWPDALEAFTGTRQMDGSAIIAYYEPLMVWLKEQNKDRKCGW
ncbi:MAG: M2 family metallopeptidase [Rhodospirillaceae bacterium]|nr:M2 family metallopeptidase [Rhodospirillaceae bacterium]